MSDEIRFRIDSEDGLEPAPAPGSPDAPWGYRDILLLVAVSLLAQVLVITFATIALLGPPGEQDREAAMEVLRRSPQIVVPLQLATWLPVLAYLWHTISVRHGVPLGRGLAWLPLPRSATVYLRTGALLALGSALVSIAIGDRTATNPMTELLSDPDALWMFGVFGVVLAPCIEEVVFRGFLFGALDRMHGTAVALVGSSAIFAALHGAQYGWQWAQLVVLLLVGLAFGAVRIRSGSSKASAIVHATYNGMLLLALIGMQGRLG